MGEKKSAKGMARKAIVIEGKNIFSLESFFAEALPKLGGGRHSDNLDAFNDLLRGGFGVFDFGAPVELVWRDYSKSPYFPEKKKLQAIIQSHTHIVFTKFG